MFGKIATFTVVGLATSTTAVGLDDFGVGLEVKRHEFEALKDDVAKNTGARRFAEDTYQKIGPFLDEVGDDLDDYLNEKRAEVDAYMRKNYPN